MDVVSKKSNKRNRSRSGSVNSIQDIEPYSTGLEITKLNFTALVDPCYLSNKENVVKAVESNLFSRLLQYDQSINGVLLAFDEVDVYLLDKPNDSKSKNKKSKKHHNKDDDENEDNDQHESLPLSGRIFFDLPTVLFPACANVLIFSPRKGMKLTGTVNNVTAGHISLLVHGSFHASIDKKKMGQGYKFNSSQSCWLSDGSRGTPKKIENGTELTFYVVSFQEAGAHSWTLVGSLIPTDF